MNFPMQAPPVMRGDQRSNQAQPPQAASLPVAQSQFDCKTICALLPAPYNSICAALCPIFLPQH
jgi:hypothetical protein